MLPGDGIPKGAKRVDKFKLGDVFQPVKTVEIPLMPLFLTDDGVDEETKKRHIDRYTVAIAMVSATGGKWLDAACGSGYGTWIISHLCEWVTGLDSDPDAIAYAQKNYGDKVNEFICRDMLKPNLDPSWGAFDCVVSIETIEHLSKDDQVVWIREVAKILKPDGIFVLTCPIRQGGGPNPLNPKHLHEPDRDELLDMLSLHFKAATHICHDVKMTTGEVQPNLYVRAVR